MLDGSGRDRMAVASRDKLNSRRNAYACALAELRAHGTSRGLPLAGAGKIRARSFHSAVGAPHGLSRIGGRGLRKSHRPLPATTTVAAFAVARPNQTVTIRFAQQEF